MDGAREALCTCTQAQAQASLHVQSCNRFAIQPDYSRNPAFGRRRRTHSPSIPSHLMCCLFLCLHPFSLEATAAAAASHFHSYSDYVSERAALLFLKLLLLRRLSCRRRASLCCRRVHVSPRIRSAILLPLPLPLSLFPLHVWVDGCRGKGRQERLPAKLAQPFVMRDGSGCSCRSSQANGERQARRQGGSRGTGDEREEEAKSSLNSCELWHLFSLSLPACLTYAFTFSRSSSSSSRHHVCTHRQSAVACAGGSAVKGPERGKKVQFFISLPNQAQKQFPCCDCCRCCCSDVLRLHFIK